MMIRNMLVLALFISTITAGCGKSGDDPAPDPNAPASVTLTTSKSVALADGSDAVTIQATVKKGDGTPADDGTLVSFSTPGGAGAVSASSAVSAGGLAAITLTHPPLSGANNQTVVVAAAAGNATGYLPVKFIYQPASVEVSVALDQPVDNLAQLQFQLISSPGASFNNADPQRIYAVNDAAGSLAIGNFDAATNTNTIGLVNAAGFAPGAGIPIIRITYTVSAGRGLPAFSIASSGTFTAKDVLGNETSSRLTATNLVITTVYDTE